MAHYFEFEVALKRIQPRIWRRLLIRTSATFRDLHDAIRAAFDWADVHLWEFRRPHDRQPLAGAPVSSDFAWEGAAPDASRVALTDFFAGREGERCAHVYELGDGWEHDVRLVAVIDDEAADFERRLTGGDRNGPPRGCEGVRGYARCVKIAQGEVHSAADLMRAEILGDWDPEAFDLESLSSAFAR